MQIPEYVKRELSEVYLLMDHIAERQDKSLDTALAAPTTGGTTIKLEQVCAVAWPPAEENRADTLALVLTAKDRLSRAAFPATAYSIAFTCLSIGPQSDTPTKGLCQRWFAQVRRWLARGANTRTSATPAAPATSDGTGTTGGREDQTPADDITTSSTMEQFAICAYPGLGALRDLLVKKFTSLACALLILLIITCFVSWDLAIGQRLLADYRWLSEHPEVMQVDPTQAQEPMPCSPTQLAKEQTLQANSAPTSTANNGKSSLDARPIAPGSLCARYLAGIRVLPMAERWISWQLPLRWTINGTPPTEVSASGKPLYDPSYQGYVLELGRVLVTTLNYDVLPLFLGALAATASALRSISRKTAGKELEPRDLLQVRSRVLLGAFLGAVIGLLISPGASNGLFALAQSSALGAATAGSETSNTVALSPAAYSFVAGFATGRIFQWFDNLIEKIFAFANPKP
jgi:hypothetical protein